MRRTDLFVHSRTGVTPLSVAADEISSVALRLAALLSEVDPHINISRDGSGSHIEVYPAAAMRWWTLPSQGYKGHAPKNIEQRHRLVDEIQSNAPWLDFGDHGTTCRRSDDALEAVLSALVAQYARLGHTCPPEDLPSAIREGWIHLPLDQTMRPRGPWSAAPPSGDDSCKPLSPPTRSVGPCVRLTQRSPC